MSVQRFSICLLCYVTMCEAILESTLQLPLVHESGLCFILPIVRDDVGVWAGSSHAPRVTHHGSPKVCMIGMAGRSLPICRINCLLFD